MKQAEPLLIAPECSAPGCHHDGDAYMMIKCHSCDQWFCEEHFSRRLRTTATDVSASPAFQRSSW